MTAAGADAIGVVLAAGRSVRMGGRAKALLTCEDGVEPFVARVARTLATAGLARVAVVGRPDDEALRAAVAALVPPVAYVPNPHAERGQLSSMLVGLDYAAALGARRVLYLPVDMPRVRTATVARVLEAAAAAREPIVRATHGGRHGHPVVFGAGAFAALRAADPDEGARSVLRGHPELVLDVEVDDPGVLADIDRPEEYERIFGRPV